MDQIVREVKCLQESLSSTEVGLFELSELQLALVGGGIGETTL